MNLYLLDCNVKGYEVCDSCVVAANSEEEARRIHPSSGFYSTYMKESSPWMDSRWANSPEAVEVKKIGVADEGVKTGLILASYNDVF